MKFSRAVDYAIRATLHLAQFDGGPPIPCRRLADEGKMPERFLLQILRSLVLKGVLVSTRGVDGGYQLKNNPAQTSLLQIIEAVEGPMDTCEVLPHGLSDSTSNLLKKELSLLVCDNRERLERIKLSALVGARA